MTLIRLVETRDGSEEHAPVSFSVIQDFLTGMGFSPEAATRCRRIRVEPDVVQVTLLSLDDDGHCFIDPTTGRVAERHYVMPVVR